MSAPRRRLIRQAQTSLTTDARDQRRVQKLRAQLEHERAALARWQKRLKRAFNTVEKLQIRVSRIEKNITRLEDP